MTDRVHVYALGVNGKREADHFQNAHLWQLDFDPATTTPQAVAVTLLKHWHGIDATAENFEQIAEYESTDEARERYKALPERVHVLRYLGHVNRAMEIGATFHDHLETSWWCRRVTS